MTSLTRAGVGFAADDDAQRAATDAVLAAVAAGRVTRPDAVFLFASSHYEGQFEALVETTGAVAECEQVVGCSATSVIAGAQEHEGNPGVVVLLVQSEAMRFHGCLVEGGEEVMTPPQLADDVANRIGRFVDATEGDNRMLVLFSDPLTMHPPRIFRRLVEVCPMPILGGAASRDPQVAQTYQWGRRLDTGRLAVGRGAVSTLVLTGEFECLPAATQSCRPIGEAFIVTEVAGEDAVGNVVRRIAGEPAVEVLKEIIETVPEADKARLRDGVFIGIALDESKLELSAGDYLVRNLTGIDPHNGSLGVGDMVREGQTIQFQLRSATAAEADLRHRLTDLSGDLGGRQPAFALYMNCMGRGRGLFSEPNHDVTRILGVLGGVPLAGLYTNSEFAPMAGRNLMHNYSGVLGVFCDSVGQP